MQRDQRLYTVQIKSLLRNAASHARGQSWLVAWWGDATALATARSPKLVQPSLGCGFPEGGADAGGHAGKRRSVLDGISAQQSSLSLGHLSRPQVFGGTY